MNEAPTLGAELLATAPLWILALSAVVLLIVDAFARAREPGFLRGPALIAVGAAWLTTARQLGAEDLDLGAFLFDGALLVDHLTVACDLTALTALAGVIAMAREHGEAATGSRRGAGFGEREVLLLLAGAGALLCIHAGDLVVLWLGVELLGVAAVATMLASHDAAATASKRAALVRSLIPQALASAILLFGVSLIFAALGTTKLDNLGAEATAAFARWAGIQRWVGAFEQFGAEIAARDPAMARQGHSEIVRGLAPVAFLLPGLLLTLVGLLAKLGALPFARRRERIEEAPLHVTALWSTVATVALICALLRFYVGALHSPRLVNQPYGWTGALPTIAALTGAWAATAALFQRRLSRVVALLCTVQVSLLLLGIVATASFHGHIGAGRRRIAPQFEILWSRITGDDAYAAVLTLLVAHVLAGLGAFAAIAAGRGRSGPDVRMQHWAGMAARRPALALAFSICLLSLVGLPPLAGFIAKVGLLRSLAEHSAMRWIIPLLVLELAACAWVVLRIIAAMYFGGETVSEPGSRREPGPWPTRVALLMAAALLFLGLDGQRLITFTRLPAASGSFEPGDEDRLEWLEQRRETWAIEDARIITEPDTDPDPDAGDTPALPSEPLEITPGPRSVDEPAAEPAQDAEFEAPMSRLPAEASSSSSPVSPSPDAP
ncbi:hypothetical protein G6O69_23325 [Pseudenhygromyxa sp. WMMC2535]|uniref:proton-conducting transporter transmembrane domain-containing protein n=1 Tax=Pseudenhygromyxa sp. WMMC2535 TaxID=2712867 RepID=UPI0015548FC4|nr:proton-conducting transporter membrane subunit [Pseudenhygromyxa sp. WMMC2535]NVB40791.1 hypothetical protein [Pseudenhygromyxa sp. WMMC2535]